MTEKIDYIKYKLQRANDAIRSAEVLLKENLWLDTLSKIYYAAFYGVSALLINMKLNKEATRYFWGAKMFMTKDKFGYIGYSTIIIKRSINKNY